MRDFAWWKWSDAFLEPNGERATIVEWQMCGSWDVLSHSPSRLTGSSTWFVDLGTSNTVQTCLSLLILNLSQKNEQHRFFISEILTHDRFHLAQLNRAGDPFMVKHFESLAKFRSLRQTRPPLWPSPTSAPWIISPSFSSQDSTHVSLSAQGALPCWPKCLPIKFWGIKPVKNYLKQWPSEK